MLRRTRLGVLGCVGAWLVVASCKRADVAPAAQTSSSLLTLPAHLGPPNCAASEQAPAVVEVVVGIGYEDRPLLFDGVVTKTRGKVRSFETPVLCRARDYAYSIQFRWDGGESAAQTLRVRGGETFKLSLP